ILELLIDGIPLRPRRRPTLGWHVGLDALDDLGLIAVFNDFEPDMVRMRMGHQHQVRFNRLPAKCLDRMWIDCHPRAFGSFNDKVRLAIPAEFWEFWRLCG